MALRSLYYILAFARLALLLLAANAEDEICGEGRQVRYDSVKVTERSNGSIEVRGLHYPPGTFWKRDESTFVGCPCLIQKCIQHCSSKYF